MVKRLALVLTALAVAAVILYRGYQQSVIQAYAREYQQAYEQLDREYRDIEDQLDVLEERKRSKNLCAMGMFLAERPDERVFTQVYPMLEEAGYTAALAFSVDAYPGQPGCISKKQFEELTEKGWTVCAAWDGEAPLSDLTAVFRTLRLPRPNVVLVESGKYSQTLDDALKQAGFSVVIHHGETLPLFEEPDRAALRHLSCLFWNHPNVAGYLEKAVQDREILILSMDFESLFADVDEELFRNMCGFMQEHEDVFPLEDLSRATMINLREEAFYQAKKEYLQGELDRCNQQIWKLYEMYKEYNPEKKPDLLHWSE